MRWTCAPVEVGVVAIDGTKLHANAEKDANLGYEQLAREILAEADGVDGEEDDRYGEGQRADVLPPEFRSSKGSRGWIREAEPIRGPRPQRLRECKRRLEEELAVECRAAERQDEVWAARAAAGKQPKSRPPKPYAPPEKPPGEINVSDPDWRRLKGSRGYLQGDNAQAAVTERQIVIAAEVGADAGDFGHLEPVWFGRTGRARAGVTNTPGVVSPTPAMEPGAHGGGRGVAASR